MKAATHAQNRGGEKQDDADKPGDHPIHSVQAYFWQIDIP